MLPVDIFFKGVCDETPAEDRQRDRTEGVKAAWEGLGILKVAKSLGIGTGTVQRVANELR
jgi:hypothetical protein